MKSLALITTLLAVIWGTAVAVDERCAIQESQMNCTGRGLTDLPPGYWQDIRRLVLTDNAIDKLYGHSFTGFPKVYYIDLSRNQLTVLELEVFADVPLLEYLTVSDNHIFSIEPAPPGLTFYYLRSFSLFENNITSLDPDILSSAPNLQSFHLFDNPYYVTGLDPIVNHEKLTLLDLQYTQAQDLSPVSLSGLPNLENLSLTISGITNITGKFVKTPLKHIGLMYNKISEITAGSFSPTGDLLDLDVRGTDLQRLEVSAVNGVVPKGGKIIIDQTPLACSCGYDSLYWWSVAKEVTLRAACGSTVCSFTRR